MLGYLIDMDGVIYRGGQLIPGADHFFHARRTLENFSPAILPQRQHPLLHRTLHELPTTDSVVGQLADFLLKVLNFIEIAAPMHGAMAHAAPAQQRRGVAQALAAAREIEDAPVLELVVEVRGDEVDAAALHFHLDADEPACEPVERCGWDDRQHPADATRGLSPLGQRPLIPDLADASWLRGGDRLLVDSTCEVEQRRTE